MGDWYISENNKLSGPASDDEIRRAIAGRRINENTLISPDGKDNWQCCGETEFFKSCFPVKSPIKLKLIPKTPAANSGQVSGDLGGAAVVADKVAPKISLKPNFKTSSPIPKVEPTVFAVKNVAATERKVAEESTAEFTTFNAAADTLASNAVPEPPVQNAVAAVFSGTATVDYDVTGEKRIVCPHCWHEFYAGNMLYISQHPELVGDPVVPEGQLRFIPKHFTKNGLAVDARGMECPDMACPRCHLRIPQIVADLNTLFFSVVGAPASGKSYFITTMINSLRHHLPEQFGISFVDADPINNVEINNYESRLFLSDTPNELVALEKTQMTGGMYDNIIWENREVNLPKPFIYQLRKFDYQNNRQKNFGVVFYDNAGEHFQPGNDDFNNPGTQHLSLSDGIVFLFDPTLDPRFRKYIASETNSADERIKMQNQNILLSEMLSRLRRRRAIGFSDKYTRPLLIAISKYD
ncbi:MAG: GYF domain-containing protein, partial [Victivallaceae bacterium]